ncbi:rho guanine nucleotide exchange factor 7 isoform X2 [Stegastes partitus]|uniref:Rho guanine nucleotide exchange factor 7 isoform X2 n=1 Tax=Stegastes partitus TaxID=144197 RepID=A0A9Y4KP16_9TELE|nr:PREDICTED: rho guanine nucleotide exchange factor 7-like isoform X2 [Stegastes partitus]
MLILSLDHSRQDFIYEGILPLSGLSFRAVSLEPDASRSPHMFEISSPMVDSKVFVCATAADLQKWMQHIDDRRHKSTAQPMSPSHCALSYLLPCDERWKREELRKYLLQAPIWQWEGSPIQHMGHPEHMSIVHIINTQRQGLQERLMVLFPQDVLLLSVDNKRLNIKYEVGPTEHQSSGEVGLAWMAGVRAER